MVIGLPGLIAGVLLGSKLIVAIFGGAVILGMTLILMGLMIGVLIDIWKESN
jgi:hypothetical protein